MSKVSFFGVIFGSLFLTYLVVAGLIAFFTVKIIGIPIGMKMFTKIVLTIILFIPLYLLISYMLSRLFTRDLKRLEGSLENLPDIEEVPDSRIREFSRLGEVIRSQARRIAGMLSDQRLMIYRLAHDLRTPTANIKNVLSAIKDRVIPPEEVDAYLDKAIGEADRIGDLLEFALSGLKKVVSEEQRERVNLADLINRLTEDWNHRTDGFEITSLCDEVNLDMPRRDLEEIINNLIENAVLHSGGTRVVVSACSRNGEVVIEVADNGKGADRDLLINSYRRGSLGLYIVKELVWKRGGDIDIESGKGGTRVAVRLPLT